MTATVTDLASQRGAPKQPCTCPRHELDALAVRVRGLLDDHDGEVLIPRDVLARALDDLTATTDRLLPPGERTQAP